MKQAILITAYKHFEQLEQLVRCFPSDQFSVYIHIDKKSAVDEHWYTVFRNEPQVKYFGQDYQIRWGGCAHLKAYLHLSRIALQDAENCYFHLITGQDIPIRPLSHFSFFLEPENLGKNFLSFTILPSKWWDGNGGLDRVVYYNFYDVLNAKNLFQKILIHGLVVLQQVLCIKRSLSTFPKLYGGSTYWSLSREALEYVVSYTDNTSILQRLRHTFCAEEILFQTLLLNSEHAVRCVDHDFRYMDWSGRNGGGPKTLGTDDYDAMMNSENFFARKIAPDSPVYNFVKKMEER